LKNLKLLALFIVVTLICFVIAGPKNIITINNEPVAKISQIDKIETASANQIYRQMVEPVVILYIMNEETLTGSGTAFSIGYNKKEDQTYFLTNNHLCNDTSLSIIRVGEQANQDQASFVYDNNPDMTFQIINTDPKNDLCLLRTDGYFKPVKINKKRTELKQAESLYIVGAPNSNFPIILETYFSGYVTRNHLSVIGTEGHAAIMVSEMLKPGHSGSPVYNEKGELIGIVFASSVRHTLSLGVGLYSYGGMVIALPDILEFLESNGIN
jgi:serine protease Do